ncbi:PLD nuclease N-terminal domain-containing protein [Actinacidiphila alni]|uniref:Phospholipase_D-nuclease N-terminal n=1 Tax=Actinacidiphila alni TaxID=380248 RepID=A0A1I2D3J4_9ACTN|nr:PLD nuclease N-terminal domain-containing protein [Actinacidiphila alni]SFE75081.1 Phospholipase_D-nuclease N-terminal [Actinacidiphila alni]
MLRYLPYLMVIALWIYAFVDCLGTPEREVRGLPKVAWVLIILFFGEVLIGPVAWLLIGRRRGPAPVRGRGGATPAEWHREYEGGRADPESEVRGFRERRRDREVAEPRPRRVWVAPDDNPEFLRSLSELNKQNRNREDGGSAPSEGDQ